MPGWSWGLIGAGASVLAVVVATTVGLCCYLRCKASGKSAGTCAAEATAGAANAYVNESEYEEPDYEDMQPAPFMTSKIYEMRQPENPAVHLE